MTDIYPPKILPNKEFSLEIKIHEVFYSNKMASFPACYFALTSKESIVLL